MKTISENSKRVKLKEQLADRIINGEFSFGDRFPGLHRLCEEYDVSYVTVNKAMKILVKEGYLQARNGVGYFVCYVPPDIMPPRKVVNFITGLDEKSPLWHMIEKAARLFEEANWKVKLIGGIRGDLSSCVADINSPDAYSVLFFTKLNWENFTATFKHVAQRVIVIGHLSGNSDITSIISDEYETVRRCIAYLRERGYCRTGIVCSSPNKELEMLRLAAWRSIMISNGADIKELDRICLTFSDPQQDDGFVKNVYSDWIRKNKDCMDSVIDPFASTIMLNVCMENGFKVPEDIAVVCIAREKPVADDGSIITLDNNLFEHFKFAFDIIEERFKTGRKTVGAWVFCPPGKFHF